MTTTATVRIATRICASMLLTSGRWPGSRARCRACDDHPGTARRPRDLGIRALKVTGNHPGSGTDMAPSPAACLRARHRMTDLTLMCNPACACGLLHRGKISICYVKWAQLHNTPSLTGLQDLCRVKSDLLPSAVSSEGDARNNQPARECLSRAGRTHRHRLFTDAVWPRDRKCRFPGASGAAPSGFREAIPAERFRDRVRRGSRTPRSAVSEVDQALLYHLG